MNPGVETHEFLNWRTARGRWLSYSVGMTITDAVHHAVHHAVLQVPASAWTPTVRSETVHGWPNWPATS